MVKVVTEGKVDKVTCPMDFLSGADGIYGVLNTAPSYLNHLRRTISVIPLSDCPFGIRSYSSI